MEQFEGDAQASETHSPTTRRQIKKYAALCIKLHGLHEKKKLIIREMGPFQSEEIPAPNSENGRGRHSHPVPVEAYGREHRSGAINRGARPPRGYVNCFPCMRIVLVEFMTAHMEVCSYLSFRETFGRKILSVPSPKVEYLTVKLNEVNNKIQETEDSLALLESQTAMACLTMTCAHN